MAETTARRTGDGAPPHGLYGFWRRLRGIHPGLVLAFLDAVGLVIASYLSIEELTGGDAGIRESFETMYSREGAEAVSGGRLDEQLVRYVSEAVAALMEST